MSLSHLTSGARTGPEHIVPTPNGSADDRPRQLVDGAAFILDVAPGLPSLWGDGDSVLWPRGEPFMLCGPAGVGKTTVAQQLTLSLIGVHGDALLGLPVQPTAAKVAYLAMDRPAQAQRSFARMVGEAARGMLEERLVVWKGPLPFDVRREPEKLLPHVVDTMGCGVVVIDSLKDLAAELSEDAAGGQVNRALQTCVAHDVDVCALHHQRKAQSGGGKPKALADVYGSTWLTAGMGSVALIWGEAGDPVVELSHLKQPAADVGPLQIKHDHLRGTSVLDRGFDLLAYMRNRGKGVTAQDVAGARFDRHDPSRAQVEKARRQLESASARGVAVRVEGQHAQGSAGVPTTYFLAEIHHQEEDF